MSDQASAPSSSSSNLPLSSPSFNPEFTLEELGSSLTPTPDESSQVRGVSDLRSRFESSNLNHSTNRVTSNPSTSIPTRLPPKIPISSTSTSTSSAPTRPPKPSTHSNTATVITTPSLTLPSIPSTEVRSPGVSSLRNIFDGVGSSTSTPGAAGGNSGSGTGMGGMNNVAVKTVPIPKPGTFNRNGSYGFPPLPTPSSVANSPLSKNGGLMGMEERGAPSPSYGFPTISHPGNSHSTPPIVPPKPHSRENSTSNEGPRSRSNSKTNIASGTHPPPIPSRGTKDSNRSSLPPNGYPHEIKGRLGSSRSSSSLNTPSGSNGNSTVTSSSTPTGELHRNRSNSQNHSSSSLNAIQYHPSISAVSGNAAPPLPSRRTISNSFETQSPTEMNHSMPPPPPPQRIVSSSHQPQPNAGRSSVTSPTTIISSPESIRPNLASSNSQISLFSDSSSPGFGGYSSLPPPPSPRNSHSHSSVVEANSSVLPPPLRSASTLPPPIPIQPNRPRSIRPSEETSSESSSDEDEYIHQFLSSEKVEEELHSNGLSGGFNRSPSHSHHSKSPLQAISSALKTGRKIYKASHQHHNSNSAKSLSSSNPSSASSMTSRNHPDLLPDSSTLNRRPPTFSPDSFIHSKASFSDFSIFGNSIVTACEKGIKIYRIGIQAIDGHGEKLCLIGGEKDGKESKLTKVALRPEGGKDEGNGGGEEDGRFLWSATKHGEIWEVDVFRNEIKDSRLNLHSCQIVLLERVGKGMISLDEGGKLCVWPPSTSASTPLTLSSSPRTQRIPMDKNSVPLILGDQLWVCSYVDSHSKSSTPTSTTAPSTSTSGPRIRIYNPFSDDKPFNALSRPLCIPPTEGVGIGAVLSGTIVPSFKDLIFLGHESGHISIWNRTTFQLLKIQPLGSNSVTTMIGVVSNLWTGNKTGKISVYSISEDLDYWRVVKRWQAHAHPILSLKIDIGIVDGKKRLQVGSFGTDFKVHVWDGLLSQDCLEEKLNEKEIESRFCDEKEIRILQCSFNIDAANPNELGEEGEAELKWLENLLRSGREKFENENEDKERRGEIGTYGEVLPDIITFGFQEVIDLESKALTAKSLLMGKKKGKEDMGERVSLQYRAWYDRLILAVRLALPSTCPYKPILSESLVGLFSIIFVKVSQLHRCRDMEVSTVKTGMKGRYGNKGAIVARVVVDDTSFCFTNCHLAAGQKHVRQRNEDVADILEASPFEGLLSDPLAYTAGGEGSMILDHTRVFWSGDLNYRIDQPRSTVISLLSSGKTQSLLSSDQLLRQLTSNPTFRLREFKEARIDFEPTYKYDRGSSEWDTSDKKRVPAWCDRILWRCKQEEDIRNREYRRWESRVSDHRPISAVFDVKVKSIDPSKRAQAQRILLESWKVEEAKLLMDAWKHYSA